MQALEALILEILRNIRTTYDLIIICKFTNGTQLTIEDIQTKDVLLSFDLDGTVVKVCNSIINIDNSKGKELLRSIILKELQSI